MAKYERNRGMYFGSWTGNAVTETAYVSVGDSKGVTKATIDTQKFGTAVNNLSGEYIFLRDDKTWRLNGTDVPTFDTTYGVTLTGDPVENDIVVVQYTAASGGWEALGKDNDNVSKELNPDTSTSKNVLGETTFTHGGYQAEIGLDPYYIDPSRKMYSRIRDNAIQENYGEADLKGFFAEAFFETANKQTRKMSGYCFVREAWYVPQSTGGDTSGYAVPVSIYPVGPMVKKRIEYDMETNEATITEIDD